MPQGSASIVRVYGFFGRGILDGGLFFISKLSKL